MERNVLKKAANYSKKRRKTLRRYKVVSVLAAVVVFCTTYALIMPAITMENYKCGLEEHFHSDSCYEMVLTCGQEEDADGHVHGPECYTTQTEHELICKLEEKAPDAGHTHDDSCYTTQTRREITCGQNETAGDPGHTHTDSCYTVTQVPRYKTVTVEDKAMMNVEVGTNEDGTPIYESREQVVGSHDEQVPDGYDEVREITCGEEERSPVEGHTHDDSCYTEVEDRTVTCGQEERPATEGHTHTEECWGDVEHQVLSCTEPEAHTHTDACYAKTLICEIPEHTHTEECREAPEENPDGSQEQPDGSQEIPDGSQEIPDGSQEIPEVTLPTVDSEGYLLDENGERVADAEGAYTQYQVGEDGKLVLGEDGKPVLVVKPADPTEDAADGIVDNVINDLLNRVVDSEGYWIDADGNRVLDENGEPIFIGLLPQPEPPAAELPVVDSEGYLLDADGQRLVNSDGSYTRYQVDENGQLVLDEDGKPILVPAQPQPIQAEPIVYTADSRFFQTRFTVNYMGEYQKDDVLTFTASIDEDQESDLTYKYIGQVVTDEFTLPLGATQFSLTRNGEQVDRREYTVDVELIPSYETIAYLYNMEQGAAFGATADEQYEDVEDAQAAEPVPGIHLYEMVYGEAVEIAHLDVDFTNFDLDSYMANSGAVYDSSYRLNAPLTGEDFMPAVAVTSNPTEDLNLTQLAWDDRLTVYWDGLAENNSSTGTHPGETESVNHHVANVTMTNSNSSKVKLGTPVTINHGPGSNGSGWHYNNRNNGVNGDKTRVGVNLKDSGIYPNATKYTTDYAMLDITPADGWYVKQVIIACAQNSKPNNGSSQTPFGCSIWSNKQGVFQQTFGVEDGTHVSILVDSEKGFGHASDSKGTTNACVYGILIQTAPIPSPLFIQYDPGIMEGKGNGAFTEANWLSGGRTTPSNQIYHDERVDEVYKKGEWNPDQDLAYTVAGISSQAETAALNEGYTFAGWQLEYFTQAGVSDENEKFYYERDYFGNGEYKRERNNNHNDKYYNGRYYYYVGRNNGGYYVRKTTSSSGSTSVSNVIVPPDRFNNVVLSNPYGSTYGDVDSGSVINLITNAKLTAIWVPNPQLTVTKNVENMSALDSLTSKEYKFRIVRTDGTPVTGYTVIETEVINGNVRDKETPVTGDTFTISRRGNGTGGSSIIRIKGLEEGKEYRIEEIETNGGTPSYEVDGVAGRDTFVAKSVKETAVSLTVTNDFEPGSYVTVRKVTNAGVDKTQTTNITDWPSLDNTTFALYKITDGVRGTEPVDILTPHAKDINPGTPSADTTEKKLEPDVLYVLEETAWPQGYAKAEDIYFKIVGGEIKLCTSGGDLLTETPEGVAIENALTLVVANYGGYVLPSTGGAGTLMYTLGGGMLMMLAAVYALVYKKSLRREGREK